MPCTWCQAYRPSGALRPPYENDEDNAHNENIDINVEAQHISNTTQPGAADNSEGNGWRGGQCMASHKKDINDVNDVFPMPPR